MSRATPEQAESRPRWWVVLRRIGAPAIRLLVVAAVVEFFLLPQLAGARAALQQLSDISGTWLAVGLLAQLLSLLAYARLTQVSLESREVGFRQLLRIDLATLAVSHVVPAGSAVGIGLGYRLLVRSGVSSARAVTGKALQTVGSAVVLNLMLGGALIAALLLHGSNPLYAPVAAVGLLLIVGAGVGAVLIARSEGRLTRFVVRVLGKVPKVDPDSGRRLVAALAGTVRRLGGDRRFLARVIGWAVINWLLEAFALWACVRAFGHSLGPVGPAGRLRAGERRRCAADHARRARHRRGHPGADSGRVRQPHGRWRSSASSPSGWRASGCRSRSASCRTRRWSGSSDIRRMKGITRRPHSTGAATPRSRGRPRQSHSSEKTAASRCITRVAVWMSASPISSRSVAQRSCHS